MTRTGVGSDKSNPGRLPERCRNVEFNAIYLDEIDQSSRLTVLIGNILSGVQPDVRFVQL